MFSVQVTILNEHGVHPRTTIWNRLPCAPQVGMLICDPNYGEVVVERVVVHPGGMFEVRVRESKSDEDRDATKKPKAQTHSRKHRTSKRNKVPEVQSRTVLGANDSASSTES